MSLRQYAMMSALVGVVVLANPAPPPLGATEALSIEKAVITFRDPVLINGRFLMGRVMFVHDEQLKARGEPCTVVYQLDEPKAPEQVASFHCKRVSRPVADQFTLGLRTTDLSFRILTAYQFRGADHAHQLLSSTEAAREHAAH